MFNKKKKSNKGFTLVELLVVIAIIGILAVVAVPSLFKNIDKAKVADLEADISAIKSATISYVSDTNKLPKNQGSTKNASDIKKVLNNELDTLSNTYNASYAITSKIAADTAVANILAANEGVIGDIILTITFDTALSDSAVTKLENDLASMTVANGKIVDSNKKIVKVVLMNAPGLGQAQ